MRTTHTKRSSQRNHAACLLVVLFACVVTFGQERTISKDEYDKQVRAAGEYRLNVSYRVTQVTETLNGPNTSEVIEYEPPSNRRVVVSRMENGALVTSSEWIFLGNKVYVKRPGLSWQIENMKYGDPVVSTKREVDLIEYKDLGIERSGRDVMKVLLRRTTSSEVVDNEVTNNVQTVKSWIDHDGRLRKQQYVNESSKSGRTTITMSYEVDPSIRIEAPIEKK